MNNFKVFLAVLILVFSFTYLESKKDDDQFEALKKQVKYYSETKVLHSDIKKVNFKSPGKLHEFIKKIIKRLPQGESDDNGIREWETRKLTRKKYSILFFKHGFKYQDLNTIITRLAITNNDDCIKTKIEKIIEQVGTLNGGNQNDLIAKLNCAKTKIKTIIEKRKNEENFLAKIMKTGDVNDISDKYRKTVVEVKKGYAAIEEEIKGKKDTKKENKSGIETEVKRLKIEGKKKKELQKKLRELKSNLYETINREKKLRQQEFKKLITTARLLTEINRIERRYLEIQGPSAKLPRKNEELIDTLKKGLKNEIINLKLLLALHEKLPGFALASPYKNDFELRLEEVKEVEKWLDVLKVGKLEENKKNIDKLKKGLDQLRNNPPPNINELKQIELIENYEKKIKYLKVEIKSLKNETKTLISKKTELKNEIDLLDDNKDKIEELYDEYEMVILKKYKKEKWTNELIDTRKILVVFLGGDNTLAKSELKIVRKKSELKQSIEDLKELWKKLRELEKKEKELKPASIPKKEMVCRLYELDPKKVRIPCEIIIKPKIAKKEKEKSEEKEFKFEIRKSNWVLLRVGVDGKIISKKHIKIEDKKLKVVVDKEETKKELRSDLMVYLNFHPARVNGKLKIWNRLGCFVGVKLSTNFLDTIAGGLSITLQDDIDLIGGVSLINEIKSDEEGIEVGDISSFSDLKEFLNRKYKPRLFFGLSFSPVAIAKILGLSD